ncbi:MAG: UDP-N-acetylglucosamine 2-epimerase (non-hydrolyzing) [Anaerolineales bacterium]|nr:UDP-N-acetylglucosamine 2-epimerase (non-hydrolyzing) [Anaerolineales bacterium]
MLIVSIVGARPQFIKAAVVSRQLRKMPAIEEVLLHTGQHYDSQMSDVFFTELELPKPDYNLEIGSDRHGAQTGQMLAAIEQVLLDVQPDWVLIYGDTNSTLAGALAAAKLHIPVAHVEAGLRSFNRQMPEEVNRIVADHLSELLLAPTGTAVANLEREGFAAENIHQVGDVMYDAVLYYSAKASQHSQILEQLGLQPKGFLLATIHRAENTDQPARLAAIFDALAALEMPVVLPLHPRTRHALQQAGRLEALAGILHIIEPLGYLDMMLLQRNAHRIITDSGGLQKEAFFQRVPCITLRTETEWRELVECGWNTLLPPTHPSTLQLDLLQALRKPAPETAPENLYGGGQAGARIAELLAAWPARN